MKCGVKLYSYGETSRALFSIKRIRQSFTRKTLLIQSEFGAIKLDKIKIHPCRTDTHFVDLLKMNIISAVSIKPKA